MEFIGMAMIHNNWKPSTINKFGHGGTKHGCNHGIFVGTQKPLFDKECIHEIMVDGCDKKNIEKSKCTK